MVRDTTARRRKGTSSPDRPPTPAVGQLGFPPSDIRSPSSGLQRSRFGSDLAGGRSAGRRRTPATRRLIPNHWNGWLLRARRERPRGCRAAEHRDELAPFPCRMKSSRTSSDVGSVIACLLASCPASPRAPLASSCGARSARWMPRSTACCRRLDNAARQRHVSLDLNRLDGLLETFYKRAIEKDRKS